MLNLRNHNESLEKENTSRDIGVKPQIIKENTRASQSKNRLPAEE